MQQVLDRTMQLLPGIAREPIGGRSVHPARCCRAGILGIAVGQTVKITSLKEAAAYGIDKAYDTANNVRVFRHISEFFRICGEGNTLYLMFYPGKPDAAFGATYGKKMIADAEGKIRMLAVSWTPQLVKKPRPLRGWVRRFICHRNSCGTRVLC
jgi:hypothetical protein